MTSRINLAKIAPGVMHAMLGLEKYLHECGLETSLLDLVRMRASQINGCAYCLDMHSKDARSGGETEQRLYLLNAWREAPFYSARERAALAWTEALTMVAESRVPDEVFEEARQHFSEEELVNLSLAVVAINGWNRLAIGFRSEVGGYRAGMASAMLKNP
ncbi:MAG TPA: carboxymuconolactone decarboxylase family protein [Geobacteraceae bacterium]|nr:carboxymuconolactone decarboxylase family protein [Geobacteraceae bacterium]